METTVICVDNSEWTRNGDYSPCRFQAQVDAVNLLAGAKTEANAENRVGILLMGRQSPQDHHNSHSRPGQNSQCHAGNNFRLIWLTSLWYASQPGPSNCHDDESPNLQKIKLQMFSAGLSSLALRRTILNAMQVAFLSDSTDCDTVIPCALQIMISDEYKCPLLGCHYCHSEDVVSVPIRFHINYISSWYA